jgi:hypothetical protein
VFHATGSHIPVFLFWLLAGAGLRAQESDGLNHERIFGVIPNYQTVDNPTPAAPPPVSRNGCFSSKNPGILSI